MDDQRLQPRVRLVGLPHGVRFALLVAAAAALLALVPALLGPSKDEMSPQVAGVTDRGKEKFMAGGV
jgi:hypothetical protein